MTISNLKRVAIVAIFAITFVFVQGTLKVPTAETVRIMESLTLCCAVIILITN